MEELEARATAVETAAEAVEEQLAVVHQMLGRAEAREEAVRALNKARLEIARLEPVQIRCREDYEQARRENEGSEALAVQIAAAEGRLEEYARLAALDAEREQTLRLLAEQEKQSADGRRAQEAEAAHLAELTARRKELHAAAVELERETAAQETLHRHLQELQELAELEHDCCSAQEQCAAAQEAYVQKRSSAEAVRDRAQRQERLFWTRRRAFWRSLCRRGYRARSAARHTTLFRHLCRRQRLRRLRCKRCRRRLLLLSASPVKPVWLPGGRRNVWNSCRLSTRGVPVLLQVGGDAGVRFDADPDAVGRTGAPPDGAGGAGC